MPPALTIDETDAINVRDVTITSSPFFIPKTSSAKSIATVPFDRDTEYLESKYSANSFSNFRHSSPVQ